MTSGVQTGLRNISQSAAGTPIMCPVGHTGIKRLLRETGGVFGGELAGHYYFRDYFYSDSAWLTAILVLSVLEDSGFTLSELTGKMKKIQFFRGNKFPC